MNLCSSNHEEICFDGRKCPFCEMVDSKDEIISALEDQVGTLKQDVVDRESEISGSQSDINALSEGSAK